jgi:CHAT domain-containing protein
LLRPLRPHLKGFSRLLISPDGALNLVPIAALMDAQGHYMAQSFEITYLSSGRDLLRTESNSGIRGSEVVLADPLFGSETSLVAQNTATGHSQRSADFDRSGLTFGPLPNTALEARSLQELLQLESSSVLLGANATETNLKRLQGPRILHVATHGFFLSDQTLTSKLYGSSTQGQSIAAMENPLLRAGIALAGANARHFGQNDDGILTALEAAQLDLHGTELVVLSACDTGVGDVRNGEGVYGLRRALMLAGAETQVTSLWRVSDEATRVLMVNYYQRLLKGEGRSAALRNAQQALLGDPRFSHPYYWASFVPSGNWTPLRALH